MSTGARAFIEYRPASRPSAQYDCVFTLHGTQIEALQLYSLTGLQGSDPTYDVDDLSLIPREEYKRLENDVVATKMLKLEPGIQLQAAIDTWKGRQPLSQPLRAALAALAALGDGARIVFFMTV